MISSGVQFGQEVRDWLRIYESHIFELRIET